MANRAASFRQWLQPDAPPYTHLATSTAVTHTEHLLQDVPLVAEINGHWERLWNEPFKGITSDGKIISNLYPEIDDEIPIESIVEAGSTLLASLDVEDRERVLLDTDAKEWRAWSNPEIYVHRFGIRLDESSKAVRLAVLKLLEATLSPEGYDKAINATLINEFLGELHNAPKVLNRWSYNFLIFGNPSVAEPWGFLLYGHHLDISVAFRGSQIVLTPTFTGAEPNEIDIGPLAGTSILAEEQVTGLQFMRSLPAALQKQAQVGNEVDDSSFLSDFLSSFPNSRWNPADQRHLCGAFQDNRVVPYEGICLSNMSQDAVQRLLDIVENFILYLPKKARENRLRQVREHINATYFCWIGGFGDDDAFYYRIQSPVIICEFDHHSGVFLSNPHPAKFHIHTIVRSPNGGDYGHKLRS